MKSIKVLLVAIAAVFMTTLPAAAQFRIGPRIGTEINQMRFDKSVFDGENRAGFTGGLMMEFTVPVIGVGMDLSVMYVHRVNAVKAGDGSNIGDELQGVLTDKTFRKRDYIEIPLNLKYKLSLPLVSKVLVPFVTTGPSFAVLVSGKAIKDGFKNKKCDVAWNFGLGLQFFSHLQVAASYGIGLNKAVDALTGINAEPIEGKNNYWTVTAAWLF